jgi:23S rRNA (guanine2445-N2)-methyltransferase / 23S rRNA (guanine2069-N7)-methyltransferase
VEADVLSWIKAERRKYGLIFLDPPTFSNSKGMKGTFDLERDHVWLLRAVSRLLARDGLLLFTSHGRRFGLDAGALPELEVEEVTRQTIPPDFVRSPRVHSAWRIRVRASGSLTGGCGLG